MQPTPTPILALVLALAGATRLPAQQGVPAVQPSAIPAPPRPAPSPKGPVEVTGIAAKVNGQVITTRELRFSLAPIAAQLAAQFPRRGPEFERQMNDAREKLLQEMIDRQIILDEFKQLEAKGANIKDFVVDEEIKRQVRELYNGDDSKFQEELKRGRLTMDDYRRRTKEKIIVQAMRQQQFADAPPPLPDEVRTEYNKIKDELRDVTKDEITFKKMFIPVADRENPIATPETQLALAEDLVKQLKAGKDFAELAKLHSRDAYAADGGNCGEPVSRMDLSPEFAAIIFNAKEGDLIGPLEDREGYTIVIPTRIIHGPVPPLDGKVRELVEERVQRQKTSVQYEKWIAGKRKKAMIKITPQ